jgi:hypothetical protein
MTMAAKISGSWRMAAAARLWHQQRKRQSIGNSAAK